MRWLLVTLTAILLLASCGSGASTTAVDAVGTGESNDDTATDTATPGVETRPELLKLTLPTADGETFDPNSLAGKPVLLWFWGSH